MHFQIRDATDIRRGNDNESARRVKEVIQALNRNLNSKSSRIFTTNCSEVGYDSYLTL